jgi:hypothetical protein
MFRVVYRRIPRLLAAILVFFAGAAVLRAEHTRYWRQASFEEFEKGTAKGVALRSDGKLVLAPKFHTLADPGLAYLWALCSDSKHNLYAAGGSSAKVLRYDPAGKVSTVFQSDELVAQALAVDAHDNLFVGTSPDGKVYEVTASGEKKTFFDPKTKYIWDIAIDTDGTAYIATGDTGQIFAVTPDGKSSLFFKSDQANIRALAFDHHHNLIAGTEPDGRVLRISQAAPDGKSRQGFVLYETPNEEVTSLLVDDSGNIYTASIGEKTRGGGVAFGPPPVAAPTPPQPQTSASGGIVITLESPAQAAPPQQAPSAPFTPLPSVSGSSVYRIAPDGSPEQLWSSRDTLVYSLGLDASGRLFLGTGNSGAVMMLDLNHLLSRLEKTETAQVTGIARETTSGKIFLCTANPAKVFSLGPEDNSEGTFESEPLDTRFFSQWGRLEWQAEMPSEPGHTANTGPRVDFFIRAGNTSNPDENWSPWAGPYSASGDKVQIPSARYAQWKAVLHSGSGSPVLDWVSLSYLPKNVAPEVQAVQLQDPGVRMQALGGSGLSAGSQPPVHLRLPQLPGTRGGNGYAGAASDSGAGRFEVTPQATFQKGYQSVLWLAHDDNDDELVYTLYYRGETEKDWKLLKDEVHDKFYSWDTSSMPDGAYYLKIVASDSPSNPPAEALQGSLESDRFVVDNTPPTILGPEAQSTSDGVRVRGTAKDPGSAIARAEYSVDAGDWKIVEPVGRLSDAQTESYDFLVQGLAPGEHTVALRVYDRYDNENVSKTTFHIEKH